MSFFSDCFKKISKKQGVFQRCSINTWSGKIEKNTPVKGCPFVVFDTELSGLDPKKDFIVSIGAIKMTGGTIYISNELYRLIRPAGEMTKKSVEIHGITPGELERKESLGSVLPEFLEFIKDSVLVGHFVDIDLRFINRALKDIYNIKLANPAVDTHTVHEWLYENGAEFKKHYSGASPKTDLFSVSQRYGIIIDEVHNALNDAFITAQLFQKFLYFLHADGVYTLRDLMDVGSA